MICAPDCVDGVVRVIEEEGCGDGVDGAAAAVHVPARVREGAGNDIEEELWGPIQKKHFGFEDRVGLIWGLGILDMCRLHAASQIVLILVCLGLM